VKNNEQTRFGMLDPGTPIPEDLAALIASRFAALAEPDRERIVGRANDGDVAVYRIADPSIAGLCDEVRGAIAQQPAGLSELLAAHQLTSVARP